MRNVYFLAYFLREEVIAEPAFLRVHEQIVYCELKDHTTCS